MMCRGKQIRQTTFCELGAGSCWATLGGAGNTWRGTKSLRVYFLGTHDSATPHSKATGGEGHTQATQELRGSCLWGDANKVIRTHTS